jgi:hypothetical protein
MGGDREGVAFYIMPSHQIIDISIGEPEHGKR